MYDRKHVKYLVRDIKSLMKQMKVNKRKKKYAENSILFTRFTTVSYKLGLYCQKYDKPIPKSLRKWRGPRV